MRRREGFSQEEIEGGNQQGVKLVEQKRVHVIKA